MERWKKDRIKIMNQQASTRPESTINLFSVKYTLIYIFLVPFINWTFTWALIWEILPGWAFNPVTIVTGLVLVFRDFSQREIGHKVLIAMFIGLCLTYWTTGADLALASGLAFIIAELVDWALYTFSKLRLSSRVLLSSALAAPIDTSVFLFMAEAMVPGMFTVPNITMSVMGKLVGAFIVFLMLRSRKL
jgi:uncharacterized PurR-regulated membrane protein YhhQ (DUF165 family)